MNIAKKALKLLASALILCFVAGSFLYADSLSGKAKSIKDKILQDAKNQNSGTTLEALRRKALDAMEFPEQMVAVYNVLSDGTKTVSRIEPVDGFYINKIALTKEDIALLIEWAESREPSYRFYDYKSKGKFFLPVESRREACLICNALSELCGLTPAYWVFPNESLVSDNKDADDRNKRFQELKKAGFSPLRDKAYYRYDAFKTVVGGLGSAEATNQIQVMQTDGFYYPSDIELDIASSSGKAIKQSKENGIFLIRKVVSLDLNAGEQ